MARNAAHGRHPYRWARRAMATLITIGAVGYFVMSAMLSHSAAAMRKLDAEEAGLVHAWPSHVQRHLYRVPIPQGATGVRFFEANAWASSELYVQFTTTPAGLRAFLAQLGTSPARLKDGDIAIVVPAEQTQHVDWRFTPGHHWASTAVHRPGLGPDTKITVDLDHPQAPVVFVVSTVTFTTPQEGGN